jgi:hypothetical protein
VTDGGEYQVERSHSETPWSFNRIKDGWSRNLSSWETVQRFFLYRSPPHCLSLAAACSGVISLWGSAISS